MNERPSVCPPTEGHLGYFQLGAIMNFMVFSGATMNFLLRVLSEHRSSFLEDKYSAYTCFVYERCVSFGFILRFILLLILYLCLFTCGYMHMDAGTARAQRHLTP